MRTGQRRKAVEAFRKALHLNPFLWTAYEALCTLGVASPSLSLSLPQPRFYLSFHMASSYLHTLPSLSLSLFLRLPLGQARTSRATRCSTSLLCRPRRQWRLLSPRPLLLPLPPPLPRRLPAFPRTQQRLTSRSSHSRCLRPRERPRSCRRRPSCAIISSIDEVPRYSLFGVSSCV